LVIPDIDEIFVWDDGSACGTDIVRLNYQADYEEKILKINKDIVELALENINLLTPYIQEMADTEFIFFVSPWSMLYWRDAVRSGAVEGIKAAYESAVGKLLAYDYSGLADFYDKDK
jgi:small-conductance mechanosensitive channel